MSITVANATIASIRRVLDSTDNDVRERNYPEALSGLNVALAAALTLIEEQQRKIEQLYRLLDILEERTAKEADR